MWGEKEGPEAVDVVIRDSISFHRVVWTYQGHNLQCRAYSNWVWWNGLLYSALHTVTSWAGSPGQFWRHRPGPSRPSGPPHPRTGSGCLGGPGHTGESEANLILNFTSTNFTNYKISEPPRYQTSQNFLKSIGKFIFVMQNYVKEWFITTLMLLPWEGPSFRVFFMTLSALNFTALQYFTISLFRPIFTLIIFFFLVKFHGLPYALKKSYHFPCLDTQGT